MCFHFFGQFWPSYVVENVEDIRITSSLSSGTELISQPEDSEEVNKDHFRPT
jgi:hypothetical protein